jgi:hypothetical protein
MSHAIGSFDNHIGAVGEEQSHILIDERERHFAGRVSGRGCTERDLGDLGGRGIESCHAP